MCDVLLHKVHAPFLYHNFICAFEGAFKFSFCVWFQDDVVNENQWN